MAAAEQAAPPASASRAERRSSNSSTSNSHDATFSRQKRFELADLLRDCAALVEQNEMEQKTFQKMFRELTEYVSAHGGGKVSDSAAAATARPTAAASPTPSDDTPNAPKPAATAAAANNTRETAAPDPPAAKPPTQRKVTTTTTKHIPPPPSAPPRAERQEQSTCHGTLSKEKSLNFMDTFKKNVKDFGQEVTQIAHSARSEAAKKATSAKNALRARNEIGAELHGEEWGDPSSRGGTSERSVTGDNHKAAAAAPAAHGRPPFQRPVNPNSTLIANGWLEQQRRSKMRFVWKEVLVSLVAGRKPGEETTLWVQRETTNPTTGQTGLEALHQIPVKGMQDVNYVDFSTDHRFVIQVYNLSDEFVFRTLNNGEAAKNWVSTLRLTREAVMNGVPPPKAGDLHGAHKRTKQYPGFSEDEKKAESPPQQNHHQAPPQQQPQQQQAAQAQPQGGRRYSVKELRAIAHGHGVKTAGMERGELEAVVAKIQQQQQQHQQNGRSTPVHNQPPPSAQKPARPAEEATNPFDEDMSERGNAERRARQLRMDEEAAARMAAEERVEAERQRMAAEERRRAEYLRQQELHRQQQAQAAAQQKWHEEQRRAQQAAEEQRRYQQQQYYAQQQAQWNQQQQQQRQAQQQWQQQQQQQRQAQQQWQQQQQQQHYQGHQTPPPGQHPQPPQPGAQARPPAPPPSGGAPPAGNSQVNQKWAKQMDDSGADGQASITAIKHHILIQWALQPPTMQMLRPIEALLTTVHTVFPPIANVGVAEHEYFKKWKTVSMESLLEEGRPDENKLNKAVKKLRFFLHPDKLPRDLSEEQTFVTKMIWDVANDAVEEYQKKKEELDWLNQS